jgi:hypothetical protein
MRPEEVARLFFSKLSYVLKGVFQLFLVGLFYSMLVIASLSIISGTLVHGLMFLRFGDGGNWDVLSVAGLFFCGVVESPITPKVMESCRIAYYPATPLIGLNKIITWVLDTNIAFLGVFFAFFILIPFTKFMENVLGIDIDNWARRRH